MANAESRSESPLSDIGSDAFTEDKFHRSRSPSNPSEMSDDSDGSVTPSTSTPRHMDTRPVKRRRVGDYDHPTPRSNLAIPGSPAGSVSSDSSGSVPTSPSFANLGPTHPLSTAYAAAQANPNDPESADYTQVTKCQWTNCPEPEQGNMDNLVSHITDVHIPPRQKKYFCEWEGCTRKSMPHTSAYALKAHMRSHTKEKPFMCQVPECDRSFTRSDALAKHMRTVHETEALRPSDPIPRGHSGGIAPHDAKANGNGNSNGGLLGRKLKLTFKGGNKSSASADPATSDPKVEGGLPALPTVSTAVEAGILSPKLAYLDPDEGREEALARAVDMDSVALKLPVDPAYYPPEIYDDMDEFERTLPPSQWYRLLRRQVRWAKEDERNFERELAEMKAKTDDLKGNPVTKQTLSKDEEPSDLVRRDEWSIVENLLDRIAGAEYEVALGRVKTLNGEAAPAAENVEQATTGSVEDASKHKVFEKVQTLPFWSKQDRIVKDEVGPIADAPSVKPVEADSIDES